jgi:hypothetical protein
VLGRPRLAAVRHAVAILATALLLGAPVAALAAPPRVGLVTGAAMARDPGRVLNDAKAAGAGWTREDFTWYRVQPSPGVWDWRASDQLMIAAAHRDLRVLPLLTGAPCWAVRRGTPSDACPPTLPARDGPFARFAARMAKRYAPGGSFWRAHRRLDGSLAPRWFELWNEPYLPPPHARSGATPERYARLVRAAVRAGRAAAPGTRWLSAATADVRDTGPRAAGGWISWARGMVRGVPDIGSYIDALAVHPYPAGRPPGYRPTSGTDPSFHATELVAQQFAAAGVPAPVWITEVGYSACEQAISPAGWCVPGASAADREQRKADWLGELLAQLDAPEYAGVGAVFVYALYEGGGTPLERRFGLMAPGGRRLPAWYAFQAAARRSQ